MKFCLNASTAVLICSAVWLPVANAVESPEHLARHPYPDRPVQILTVRDGSLGVSDGSTIIERSLLTLREKYGVRINQKALAGYIIDLDQADREMQYEGFDLDAHIDESYFAPWFHNPMPDNEGSTAYTDFLWKYATTGVRDNGEKYLLSYAVAYTHIDHVFFPMNKFASGFYYDEASTRPKLRQCWRFWSRHNGHSGMAS